MPLTPLRSAVLSAPGVRAITETRPAQEAIHAVRVARTVQPWTEFLRGEARRGKVGSYKIRGMWASVTVRHRTRDIAMIDEVFSARTYEPPVELMLGGPVRVIDAGGNIGAFGLYALSRWNVEQITSYEPDPANAELLTRTALARTAGDTERWTVRASAVSNANGTLRFVAGRYSESRAARPGEPSITVPLVDLLEQPAADLIKLDIEGGEWPILEDPRLATLPARAIVLEWHANECRVADAPGHASRLLERAGYTVQVHRPRRLDSNGLLWAWRP